MGRERHQWTTLDWVGRGRAAAPGVRSRAGLSLGTALPRIPLRPDQTRPSSGWAGGFLVTAGRGTHPASAAGPKPTPHVLRLVQREVDLVDLPARYGIWGDEEADPCDRAEGGPSLPGCKDTKHCQPVCESPFEDGSVLASPGDRGATGTAQLSTQQEANHSDPKRAQRHLGGQSMPSEPGHRKHRDKRCQGCWTYLLLPCLKPSLTPTR